MDKYYTDSMQEAGARLENLLITPPLCGRQPRKIGYDHDALDCLRAGVRQTMEEALRPRIIEEYTAPLMVQEYPYC